ncbi:hypothetical protein CFOL_v3_13711, partial [Cephalotus follicularis]
IEVAKSPKSIFISQHKYVINLLTETGMLGAKPSDSPMDTNVKLYLDEGGNVLSDTKSYHRLVGKLNYLGVTRPDIGFFVSVVSQFMSSPRSTNMDAVMRILQYLKKAFGKGVLFQNHGHTDVEGYFDADWAGSPSNKKSTSGYCVFVGGNSIAWKSKKQDVVARSNVEA